MTFSLRRLFWLTTIVVIYTAAFARIGIELTAISALLGFGLMSVVSKSIRSEKYLNNDRFGWDVLFVCFAIPVLVVMIAIPSHLRHSRLTESGFADLMNLF